MAEPLIVDGVRGSLGVLLRTHGDSEGQRQGLRLSCLRCFQGKSEIHSVLAILGFCLLACLLVFETGSPVAQVDIVCICSHCC